MTSRDSATPSPRLIVAAATAVAIAFLLLPARSLAQATPQGCGYGTGGPNATTLCWIDMSGYNDADARSPSGQAMAVRLPGGYTISFTITSRTVRVLRGAIGSRINRATLSGLQARPRMARAAIRVLPARAQGGGVTG